MKTSTIVIIAVVLVGLAVGAYFLFGKKKTTTTDSKGTGTDATKANTDTAAVTK